MGIKPLSTLVALIVVLSIEGFSQRNLHLSTGTSVIHLKDEIVSRSIYSGNLFSIESSKSFLANSGIHQVSIAFETGTAHSDTENQLNIWGGNLSYARMFPLQERRKLSHYAGFGVDISALIATSSFRVGRVTQKGRDTGYINLALSAAYQLELTISESVQGRFEASVPLLNNRYRPGYSASSPDELLSGASFGNVLKSGDVNTIFTQPSFLLKTGIEKQVKNGFFLGIFTSIGFFSSEEEKNINYLSNNISISGRLSL